MRLMGQLTGLNVAEFWAGSNVQLVSFWSFIQTLRSFAVAHAEGDDLRPLGAGGVRRADLKLHPAPFHSTCNRPACSRTGQGSGSRVSTSRRAGSSPRRRRTQRRG